MHHWQFCVHPVIMSPAKKSKRPMSDEHKAALAEGRAQGRAVRRYLEALEANRPKRGRKRTPESIQKRLDAIAIELADTPLYKAVDLVQEQMDLQQELARSGDTTVDLTALEEEFIANAKGYSERKKISRAAWRKVGVPPGVLDRAGI